MPPRRLTIQQNNAIGAVATTLPTINNNDDNNIQLKRIMNNLEIINSLIKSINLKYDKLSITLNEMLTNEQLNFIEYLVMENLLINYILDIR